MQVTGRINTGEMLGLFTANEFSGHRFKPFRLGETKSRLNGNESRVPGPNRWIHGFTVSRADPGDVTAKSRGAAVAKIAAKAGTYSRQSKRND